MCLMCQEEVRRERGGGHVCGRGGRGLEIQLGELDPLEGTVYSRALLNNYPG